MIHENKAAFPTEIGGLHNNLDNLELYFYIITYVFIATVKRTIYKFWVQNIRALSGSIHKGVALRLDSNQETRNFSQRTKWTWQPEKTLSFCIFLECYYAANDPNRIKIKINLRQWNGRINFDFK